MADLNAIIQQNIQDGQDVHIADVTERRTVENVTANIKQQHEQLKKSTLNEFEASPFYRLLHQGLTLLKEREFSLVYDRGPWVGDDASTTYINLHKRPFSWANAMSEGQARITIVATRQSVIVKTRQNNILFETALPQGWNESAITMQIVGELLGKVTFEAASQGLLPNEEDIYAKNFREREERGEIKYVSSVNPDYYKLSKNDQDVLDKKAWAAIDLNEKNWHSLSIHEKTDRLVNAINREFEQYLLADTPLQATLPLDKEKLEEPVL